MEFYLYRIFADGEQSTVVCDNGTLSDMVERSIYAARLTVLDEVPTAILIKGDRLDTGFKRMATEAAQEIFGR